MLKYYCIIPIVAGLSLENAFEIRNLISKPMFSTGIPDTQTGQIIWSKADWILLEGYHNQSCLDEVSAKGGFAFTLDQFNSWYNEFIPI